MRTRIAIPRTKLILTLVILLSLMFSIWFFVEHHTLLHWLGITLTSILLLAYLIQWRRLRGNERYYFIESSFYRSLYLLIGLGVLLLWETWKV